MYIFIPPNMEEMTTNFTIAPCMEDIAGEVGNIFNDIFTPWGLLQCLLIRSFTVCMYICVYV